MPHYLAINTITAAGRVFGLRSTLLVKLGERNGSWACSYKKLHLWGWGATAEAALDKLMADFAVAYEGLVESDDLLTEDAQAAKARFEDLVIRSEK